MPTKEEIAKELKLQPGDYLIKITEGILYIFTNIEFSEESDNQLSKSYYASKMLQDAVVYSMHVSYGGEGAFILIDSSDPRFLRVEDDAAAVAPEVTIEAAAAPETGAAVDAPLQVAEYGGGPGVWTAATDVGNDAAIYDMLAGGASGFGPGSF